MNTEDKLLLGKTVGCGLNPSKALLKRLLKLDKSAAREDYLNNQEAAVGRLEALGCDPFVTDAEGGWVCAFDHDGEVCVTTPYKKPAQAAFIALLFVTENKSVVT